MKSPMKYVVGFILIPAAVVGAVAGVMAVRAKMDQPPLPPLPPPLHAGERPYTGPIFTAVPRP